MIGGHWRGRRSPCYVPDLRHKQRGRKIMRTTFRVAGNLAGALVCGAALALTAAGPAPAQDAPQHVRGKVTSVAPDAVTVKLKTGTPVTVKLAPTWTVAAMKTVDMSAIKPG